MNQPPVYNDGIPAEVDPDVSMRSPDSYTVPANALSSPADLALTYSAPKQGAESEVFPRSHAGTHS